MTSRDTEYFKLGAFTVRTRMIENNNQKLYSTLLNAFKFSVYNLQNVYNLCSLLKKDSNPQTILSLTTLIKYGIYSLNKFNNYENALFFSKKTVDMLTPLPRTQSP